MNAFLILSTDGATLFPVAEWKSTFVEVQEEMNRLEKSGVVTGVTVQKFENNLLTKEITYDYNGEEWEKRKTIKTK